MSLITVSGIPQQGPGQLKVPGQGPQSKVVKGTQLEVLRMARDVQRAFPRAEIALHIEED